jgi:hypothetical protein
MQSPSAQAGEITGNRRITSSATTYLTSYVLRVCPWVSVNKCSIGKSVWVSFQTTEQSGQDTTIFHSCNSLDCIHCFFVSLLHVRNETRNENQICAECLKITGLHSFRLQAIASLNSLQENKQVAKVNNKYLTREQMESKLSHQQEELSNARSQFLFSGVDLIDIKWQFKNVKSSLGNILKQDPWRIYGRAW